MVGPIGVGVIMSLAVAAASAESRELPIAEYRDRMTAGWIGQMVGVGWGWPTEFRYRARIIPEHEVPAWEPELVNQFRQDDLYVEMTFLRTLEVYGLDVSTRQAGIDFANSTYRLWSANWTGRDNLRAGIAPPDSGHPQFNSRADGIDYQIEADFAGLMAPGCPDTVIAMGETFGRLMNYGDGVYGGQFIAGMYAEAFFEDDPVRLVEAGLSCIPASSQYAEAIRDVLSWREQYPDDWQATWRLVTEKYHHEPDYRQCSCVTRRDFNIDAKINGAYAAIGLLYGQRDPDQTIIIAMRCGQDSDCNPASAAGILFTTMGRAALPARFTSGLDAELVFCDSTYNFEQLIDTCVELARQAVVANGGSIEMDGDEEVFVIPVSQAVPSPLEQCSQPGPIAHARFTDEEMAQIVEDGGIAIFACGPRSCGVGVPMTALVTTSMLAMVGWRRPRTTGPVGRRP